VYGVWLGTDEKGDEKLTDEWDKGKRIREIS
jgi:hypothetical protein